MYGLALPPAPAVASPPALTPVVSPPQAFPALSCRPGYPAQGFPVKAVLFSHRERIAAPRGKTDFSRRFPGAIGRNLHRSPMPELTIVEGNGCER